MPTGVEGLDALAGGGLPRRRTSLFLGAPGTGKTVLAMQTLLNGAREYAEESRRRKQATRELRTELSTDKSGRPRRRRR